MGEKHTTARLTKAGEHFEILVHPKDALDFKLGKTSDLSRVLVTTIIFTDASKGMKASEDKLQKAFNTKDPFKVAETILMKGELLITAEQRHELIENKRKQIIAFISRRCVDPRTDLPHPPVRIEQAMSQIQFSIDPFKDANEQAMEVIDALRPVLPMKIEVTRMAVKIPPEYAAKSIGVVKQFSKIEREEWQADGSWIAIVNMPAGLRVSFLEKLENITRGSLQAKILK